MEDSHRVTVKLIKALLPFFEEMIAETRKNHGYFKFESQLIPFLSKGHETPWATNYQSLGQLKLLAIFSFFEPSEIPELAKHIKESTLSEKQEMAARLKELALETTEEDKALDSVPVITEQDAKDRWAALGPEERVDETTRATLLLYAVITQFCHYCGLMTFGRSLCDLVADAIAGDDIAFCKAVQLDKTILYSIPYFRERLARAQLSADLVFLQKLSTAITGKQLAGYIKHKELMFVFAILDDEGMLGLPAEELFDLCEELGIYGQRFGIFDVGTFRKRRSYYLKMTGRKLSDSRPSPA
jgi:hypothetical protein